MFLRFIDYSLVVQICAIFLIGVIAHVVTNFILRRAKIGAAKTKGIWDDVLFYALERPLVLGIWLMVCSYSLQVMDNNYEEVSFTKYIEYTRGVGLSVLIGWFLYRFIRESEQKLVSVDYHALDPTTVNAISRSLRAVLIIIVSFLVMQNLGYEITGFVTFSAVSTLVLAIGAKDAISNIGGGILIYFNRPFAVGDWIRSPDQEIEGDVEYIGWRLTRIRTLDKRPLYVPNSVFAKISIENPSRMTNRRIKTMINLRYEDAKKIPIILADIRRMMATHEELDLSKTCMVCVVELSSHSIICMISAFTKTIDTAKFHMVQQDVLLRALDIIHGHGAKMAYPTSITHVPGIDHKTMENI